LNTGTTPAEEMAEMMGRKYDRLLYTVSSRSNEKKAKMRP